MSEDVLGRVTAAEPQILRNEIAEQLRLLRSDPELREEAAEAGVDLAALDALPEDADLFAVEEPKNKLSGIGEAIVIKIAVNVGAAATIALANVIWKHVIKPAIDKGGREVEDMTKSDT